MKRQAEDIFHDVLSNRKSNSSYEIEWSRFLHYSNLSPKPHPGDITEDMLIEYLDFLHTKLQLAPTTVWSSFSKINTCYQDIGGKKLQDLYPRLTKVMKRYQEGYIPKRAQVFTGEQIRKYLDESPNNGKNSLMKVVVCFGMYGGLRCAELIKIDYSDITLRENGAWVTYSVAKIKGSFHKTNQFVVPNGDDKFVIQYMNQIDKEGRLFKTFNGKKFSKQPMGIRTICKVPQSVAAFLNISGNFSGHCFRRSCATILAEQGATSTQLKTLMNWKSDTTALNYIDNSEQSRLNTSLMISSSSSSTACCSSTSKTSAIKTSKNIDSGNDFSGASFTNCVFNFN